MTAELIAERHDSSLILTFSNPGSGNALDPSMLAAAIETLSAAERDESLQAVVLTGAAGHFSRGLMLPKEQAAALAALESLHSLVDILRSYRKPVIAAAEGLAADAALALLLSCDLIVAGTTAQFGLSAAQRDLWVSGGASWLLTQALAPALVAELHLDATPLKAQRLHAAGVINRLAPQGRALEEALAWAEALAGQAPGTSQQVERLKDMLHDTQTESLADHFSAEKRRLGAARHLA